MTCEQATTRLHEFLDHELSGQRHSEVGAHLASCPSCRRMYEFEQQLRNTVWEKGREEKAPAYVFERVKRNVFEKKKREVKDRSERSWMGLRPAWNWAVAALVAVTVAGTWVALRGKGGPPPLLAELVGDHMQYAEAEKPSEMVSSDADEIEIWLEGKLGYAIVVPRFEGPHMHLIGGRILDVKGMKVAYLFYQGDGRALSLYVTKVSTAELCAKDKLQLQDCRLCLVKFHNCELCISKFRDYNILSWEEEGVTYAMVSDLDSEHMLDVTCPRGIPS
ncbi:MAG: anti-sigma factor [Gemmatimonadota bacterium]|nr:MAG: anti-sigma factor [Gemmatimonadota bacterium]